MKIDSVLLFETPFVKSLYPFSALHCGWELRCGAFRQFERVQKLFPSSRLIFHGREKHLKSFLARFEHANQEIKKENILIINSALIFDLKLKNEIESAYNVYLKSGNTAKSVAFSYMDTPLAVLMVAEEMINPINFDKEFLPKLLSDYNQILPRIEIKLPKVNNFLWDAIELNTEVIKDDVCFFNNFGKFDSDGYKGVFAENEDNIYIGKDVKIQPGVVLNAEDGPIIIDNNVKILAQSMIAGPCYIGAHSIIKAGAKIYEANSFGEFCKVGGEVENSIIQSYSNKQHDGFLGHSFISEWVNIGADTNTSDLKNTYSNIVVRIKGERFNTGRMFLGLICGDHTKTAIMTRFNTGTICGIGGVLFDAGFLPAFIPSFSWGGSKDSGTYEFDSFLDTAHKVTARRGKKLSEPEIELLRDEYNNL